MFIGAPPAAWNPCRATAWLPQWRQRPVVVPPWDSGLPTYCILADGRRSNYGRNARVRPEFLHHSLYPNKSIITDRSI